MTMRHLSERPPAQAVKLDDRQVLACVRRHERRFRGRWLMLLILGFGALWIGPLLAATILWVMEFHAGGIPDSWGYIFVWCILIIPLMFLLEWVSRGTFMDSAVDGIGGEDNMSASYSHRQMAVLALLTEMSLWGPRIIISSCKRLGGAARLGGRSGELGAVVLGVLARRDEGMASSAVLNACGLDADQFGDALGYLLFHEWIDISKDGVQVWMLTDARKRLR